MHTRKMIAGLLTAALWIGAGPASAQTKQGVPLEPGALRGSTAQLHIDGAVRSFSPNGHYALIGTRDGFHVYDTRNWAWLGGLDYRKDFPHAAGYRHYQALIDDRRQIGLLFGFRKVDDTSNDTDVVSAVWHLVEQDGTTHYALTGAHRAGDRAPLLNSRPLTLRKGILHQRLSRLVSAEQRYIRNSREILDDWVDHKYVTADCPVHDSLPDDSLITASLSDSSCVRAYETVSMTRGNPLLHRHVSDLYISDGQHRQVARSHAAYGVRSPEWVSSYSFTTTNEGGKYVPVYKNNDEELAAKGTRDDHYRFNGGSIMVRLQEHKIQGVWVVPTGDMPAFPLEFSAAEGIDTRKWLFIRTHPNGTMVSIEHENGKPAIFSPQTLLDPFRGKPRDVVVDLAMSRILSLSQADKHKEALGYFAYLETLDVKLPESFLPTYAGALERAGRMADARARAEAYIARYGRKGKFYDTMISLYAR